MSSKIQVDYSISETKYYRLEVELDDDLVLDNIEQHIKKNIDKSKLLSSGISDIDVISVIQDGEVVKDVNDKLRLL